MAEKEIESLMVFPCDFPIKIIGNNTEAFKTAITEITCRHFPGFKSESMVFKQSAKHNFLAITVTVLAENQIMLDAFYQEVTKHPEIKMVL